MFDAELLRDVKTHAAGDYPKECCGLVIGGKYIRLPNIAADPYKTFAMPRDVFEKFGYQNIQAVIHSHPDNWPFPSASDMEGQGVMPDIPWGIIAVHHGEPVHDILWFGECLPRPDYLGRTFIHGITDCYALVRDWYAKERNVKLPLSPRNYQWWLRGEDLITPVFAQNGFEVIPMEPKGIEVGDIPLFALYPAGWKEGRAINHGGVYTGQGLFMHQLWCDPASHGAKRLSKREPIGPWLSCCSMLLRYTK